MNGMINRMLAELIYFWDAYLLFGLGVMLILILLILVSMK
jgi:hypothetical protein